VTPIAFFTLWRNSAGHNANMLDERYTVAGMGFALGSPERGVGGLTGTQMFGIEHTGADYTALDMLIPGACEPARTKLRRAKAQLAAAKESGKGVAKAKRKVKKRKKAATAACKPDDF
jgi:hypothetical protein